MKLAGYGITAADVGTALANNNFVSAVGRTDGQMFIRNLTADTDIEDVDGFRKMIIKQQNGAIVHLGDIAKVELGAQNYNSAVSFDGRTAVYIGIKVAPSANLLTVIDNVRKAYPSINDQLPQGLKSNIVYDSSKFVSSSIYEVIRTLLEAFIMSRSSFIFSRIHAFCHDSHYCHSLSSSVPF